jgi:hypothetical protein
MILFLLKKDKRCAGYKIIPDAWFKKPYKNDTMV